MEEIERLATELQQENDQKTASDPTIQTSLGVVEAFLKNHPVLCYGGTAINNLLPVKDRFYNPKFDIPDYDFFSKTPQEHATVVANQLAEKGILNIEVKPGMHLGTFKVFANYEGVADITYLEPVLFDRLWKEDIVREGIHYVSPNFLRMSMYLELSRPRGDVSRWTKVFGRLELLNKEYPSTCPANKTEFHKPITAEKKAELMKLLKSEPVVLLAVSASEIHTNEELTTPIALLAEKSVIDRLIEGSKTKVDAATEILPPRTSILDDDGKAVVRFYETTACHSFHTTPSGIRVASIPTILQFFFAYIYTDENDSNIANILCIAQKLVDMANHKPKRRFALLTPKECLGKQETLVDMKKHKAELYSKLSKDRSSPEFLQYFYTYNPRDTARTRRKNRRNLQKTRKARSVV
jgi:hypothetical protein